MITLKQPDTKNAYLDYLLVIPSDLYSHHQLDEEDLDRTGEFISSCGNNHFNIDTKKEGFCRDSVFSITASHNGGARACECDFAGSLSFECEKFGGQCQCKPNIIGRQCKACKTGYYGFPDCLPCNCPSTAFCEPHTGRCICPPHVLGERCDQCEPLTYGYDPIIGCEECKCNSLGVRNGNFQCDLLNGTCPCLPNVVGRSCDVCLAGHYSFPYCESCECDIRGSTPDICDQLTAECFCKKYATGLRCDFCRDGTFNLQANNEEGCTECFCFGKSSRCTSAQLIKSPISDLQNWEVVGVNLTEHLNVTKLNLVVQSLSNSIGVDFNEFDLDGKTVYVAAPLSYLGKRLTSYGGYLSYTIFYGIGSSGKAVSGPDVILQGADTYLTFNSFEQPPPAEEYKTSVQFVESNFEIWPLGVPARREHIMEVLNNLQGIYLRATYWSNSITTRFINILLDSGEEPFNNRFEMPSDNSMIISSVERCVCPPNYQGLSCEDCAPGYYRVKTGPHGGYCVPCQCNGHATECDVETGVCLNCTHNTRGDHCELCNEGYHGSALAGTPMDCLICACPLPIASNNFAKACDVSTDGERISCQCREGYFGARCQSCASGYYGRPEIQGDYCKPCQCSGNINPEDPASCDTVTGECLRCLNNTFGIACSLCAPGYFGDAVNLKDCQACICDPLGTSHCDSYTGKCICKPNVVGEKCDRCEVEHFGFQSGQGCQACECAEASESDQCEDATGQCKCKPGVTGRSCDRCSAGYWNYTANGCTSCGCKSEYSLGFGCNALTGQCECLQGVVGEKCDQCPHRWAFIPEYGCHQCDSCTHSLLDDTDSLASLIDPVMIEFDSTQSGYFTRRRLDNMKEQLGKLSERFEHIDPQQIDLTASIQELEGLEQDSKNLNRQSNYSLEQSDDLQNKSAELQNRMEIISEDLENAKDEVLKVTDDIDSIAFSLNEEKPEIESALAQAEELLNNMKIYNLTGRETEANKELDRVMDLLKNVTEIKQPADDLEDEVDKIKDSIKTFNDKLDDLYNHTQYSSNIAQQAQDAMERSGKDKFKTKLENIEKEVEKSQGNLADSRKLLDNTSSLLDDSIGKLKRLKDLPEVLDSKNNEFNSSIQNNDEELKKVIKMKPEVERHASDLSYRAEELSRLVSESKNTDDAIKAARAYQDIVQAVKDAKEAVEHAENNTNMAINELDNVNNRSTEANWEAQSALDKAHATKKDRKEKLEEELKTARSVYLPVKEGHNKNIELLNDIKRKLNNIGQISHETAYKEASENADNAVTDVSGVKDSISNTYSELPMETDKAKMLPKNMLDVKRNIDQTEKQINEINEKLPPVLEALDQLPERQQNLEALTGNIKNNINKLGQQIELARDIANRIKIGMRFYPNTTLELRNPPNIEDLSTSTKITGYFRTPQQSGLIWYLGNPTGTNLRRTKSDDYMALILQNGYPVLKLDLGNGQEQIILKKYVADNNWYQFIIERVGHNAKLSIREELPDGQERITTEEKTLAGPYTIFNLDQEKSKLFVGSFPVNYEMQKGIDISSFDGEIDTLVIGDKPVSLWNFNHGYENNHGAMERNRLIDQPDNGFSFNGNGYLVLDGRPYKFRGQSVVQFHFKTYATEGLLFLAGKGSTFLALELRNGKIIYQYNLGKGTKIWPTRKTYNDGRWHKVVASRDGPKGKLFVDDEDILDKTKEIQGNNLEPIDTISFGGYPSKHNYPEVTQTKFVGCIHNVTIMGQSIDLRDNLKAYDITTVCPDKVAQLVSFDKNRAGYVGWDGLAISNDFKVTLKFKTKEKDGLIFYATNKEQSDGISLAISNGRLKVISQKTELISKDTFNDSAWHVVSVIHNQEMLRVDFDDYGYKVTDHAPPQLYLIYGMLFVGGLPRRIQPLPGTVGSTVPFSGCIADLTVNGEVKNFANTTEKSSEYIDKCLLDATKEILTDVHKLPPLPPIGEFIPFQTRAPEVETEDPLRPHGVTRGDGGFDFVPDEKITIRPPERRPIETPAPIGRPVGTVPPSTAKPPAPDGCALPLNPSYEPEALNTYRFGTQSVSRFEYKNPRGKFKKNFEFSLDLKTAEPNGVIFYISDTMAHLQYVALYLKDGKLTFVFKGDRDPIVMTTSDAYNDNKWHAVQFSRDGGNGKLIVDDNTYIQTGERTHSLDVRPPFYLGGLKHEDYENVFKNINTTEKFQGCIRNFLMNSKPMDITFKEGVIPCSDNVESGTYFGGGTHTYVKLKDKFKVGYSFNIKLEIKPRVNTGLLISVYGKKDYFVLEMVNGNMTVSVENGKGKISATYEPSSKFSLCDGNWHSIQAIKSKNVVTLSVDNIFTNPRVGDHSATSTDTGGALFMGGHRLMAKLHRGVSPHPQPYVGCIRNVVLNNDPVELEPSMVEGDVIIGSCRTN